MKNRKLGRSNLEVSSIGFGCMGLNFGYATSVTKDEGIKLIREITVAARTDGPPQHRHARHDEGFYVVSGTARFTVGQTTW